MKNILKQTSYVFLGQALARVISFFYVIFLARNLGVEDFGLYTVALAYFSIISELSEFGFNRFLTREVARDNSKAWELLWNLSLLRLTLTSVLFAVFAVGLYVLDPDKLRVSIILLATLAILPQAVAFTFDAVFVALQKLQYSAIALLIIGLSTTLIGFILVSFGFGAVGAVNALILGQLIYAVTLIIFLSVSFGIHFPQISFTVMKKAITGSLPYGILGILGLLYFKIDVVLLAYLKGNFDTGIYGAAYKFLEAVIFIPTSLSLALFPVLAKLHDEEPQKIRPLYFSALKIMGGLGILITLGYIVFLPIVIKLFLPNYQQSVDVIKILVFTIPFMFIHIPGAQILLSTDKYLRPVLILSLLTLSFNVISNLIFIPQFGFIGAAWVTVASEALSFFVFFLLLKKKVL